MSVYEKILQVMQKVQYLQKDGYVETSKGKGYKAMTDEKVASVLRPALLEARLVILPVKCEAKRTDEVVTQADNQGNTYEKRNRVTDVHGIYRIVDVDNPSDYVDVESCGCGVDTQDKGVGKAMTYSRKYMLLNTFLIPTGNDTDDVSSEMYDNALYGAPVDEADKIKQELLEIAKGDIEGLNGVISKITEGKFDSMDGLNLPQLIAVKKIITAAKKK